MQGGFAAIDSALASVDRKDVRGIGISGQQHGFVPMDGEGQVATCFPLSIQCCAFSFPHDMFPMMHNHLEIAAVAPSEAACVHMLLPRPHACTCASNT